MTKNIKLILSAFIVLISISLSLMVVFPDQRNEFLDGTLRASLILGILGGGFSLAFLLSKDR